MTSIKPEFKSDGTPSEQSVECLATAFVATLADWLSAEEFGIVRQRNATPEYAGCCASHDVCDANEAMLVAWAVTFNGRPRLLVDDEENRGHEKAVAADMLLWNTAWGHARTRWLTEAPTNPQTMSPAAVSVLARAALDAALERACYLIQTVVGQEDDSVAALHFNEDETDNATPTIDRLRAYIESELGFLATAEQLEGGENGRPN